MVSAVAVLAYFVPGVMEWILLLMLGLLLFGRRLPEVGRAAGRTLADLRRGFDQFKRELDRDESLSSAKNSFRDARQSFGDLRRTVTAPARAVDPRRVFDDLTDSARSVEIAEPDPGIGDAPESDGAPRPDPAAPARGELTGGEVPGDATDPGPQPETTPRTSPDAS